MAMSNIGDPARVTPRQPRSTHDGEGILRRVHGMTPIVPLASDVGPSPTDPGPDFVTNSGVNLVHAEVRHQIQDLVDLANRQIRQSPLRETVSLAMVVRSGRTTVVVVDTRTDEVLREVSLNKLARAASQKTGIAGILKDLRA